MSKARQLADLLDSNGDVVAGALDNAPDPDLTPYATTASLNTLQSQVDNISSELIDDTTPQLAGTLDTNGNPINDTNGVDVQHNGSTKLSTSSTGVAVTGDMTLSSNGAVNSELRSDWAGLQLGTTSNHYMAFRTNNTERARIDTSGNMSVTGSVKTVNTAKVWVEFAGSGTVSVRNDFNISSITDIGQGQYTLNFNDALANNNYALVGVSSQAHQLGIVAYDQTSPYTRTTSAVLIRNRRNANSTEDADYISVVLFGDD